jgi:outer membrane protein TolC
MRVTIGFLLTGAFLAGPAVTQEPPQALSLATAVQLALERNPDLLAARQELPAAESRLRMARSEGRPRASANTYLSTGTMGSTLPSPDSVMPRMYMGVPPRSRLDQNLTLMAPLSTGGRVRARIRGAAARVEQTERDIDAMALEVAYEAREAYWMALLNREMVRVEAENANEQGERLRIDQAAHDAGKIPLFYVLRDKAEVAAAEQALTNARRDADKALLDLRRAIGLALALPVELTDSLVYRPDEADRDPGELVAKARQDRPEARALSAQIAAADREVLARKAAYRPQVDAMLMLDAEKTAGDPFRSGYTAGLVASLPLLDGGSRSAEVSEALAMRANLEHRQEALGLDIEREVRAALLDLAAADQNVRTAAEAVAAAEEDYRVAKVGFGAGKLINLEVISALAALVQARTNVALAVYEHNLAADAVRRSTGSMPDGG